MAIEFECNLEKEYEHKGVDIWGAACRNVHINKDDKNVIFECVENGEPFETQISFEELEEEYGYDLPVMV